MATDMDALAVGSFLVLKKEQQAIPSTAERQKHLAQFPLD